MTDSRQTPARVYAYFLRDWLPAVRPEVLQVAKEATQTVVWIVTLSSGLLTFIAVNRTLLQGLSADTARWLLAALMLTVLCGVLQRVVQLAYFRVSTLLELELDAALKLGTASSDSPAAPGELDDREEIIAELKRFFDLDYSFLRSATTTEEHAREAYLVQFNHWKNRESDIVARVQELLAAAQGKFATIEETKNQQSWFDVDVMRKRGKRVRMLGRLAVTLFTLTTVSFLAATGILGFGIVNWPANPAFESLLEN